MSENGSGGKDGPKRTPETGSKSTAKRETGGQSASGSGATRRFRPSRRKGRGGMGSRFQPNRTATRDVSPSRRSAAVDRRRTVESLVRRSTTRSRHGSGRGRGRGRSSGRGGRGFVSNAQMVLGGGDEPVVKPGRAPAVGNASAPARSSSSGGGGSSAHTKLQKGLSKKAKAHAAYQRRVKAPVNPSSSRMDIDDDVFDGSEALQEPTSAYPPISLPHKQQRQDTKRASLAAQILSLTDKSRRTQNVRNPEVQPLFFVQLPATLPVQDFESKESTGGDTADTTSASAALGVTGMSQSGSVSPDTIAPLRRSLKRQQRLFEEHLSAFDQKSPDSLATFPAGRIGVLRVHKSGKIRLHLGGGDATAAPVLEMREGTKCRFHQEFVAVHAEEGRAVELGDVDARLVCSLDVESLLGANTT